MLMRRSWRPSPRFAIHSWYSLGLLYSCRDAFTCVGILQLCVSHEMTDCFGVGEPLDYNAYKPLFRSYPTLGK